MDKLNLNLAAICRKTNALGPGNRAVIWVQGCPFRCKGCIAPEWIPLRAAWKIQPALLAEELLREPELDGLTISGGEPVLQASALAELVTQVKAWRDVDVILFTGYYYENLLAFPEHSPVRRLLKLVDVLIDGPYDEKKNDNRGMRGSSNQRILHLTERLKAYDFQNQPRQTEIHLSDGEMLFVGVPPKGVIPGVTGAIPGRMGVSPREGHYEWT